MVKRISTLEIRQQLGDVLNRVNLRDDQYVVERKGKPLAAIVPLWQLEKWQQLKSQFWNKIQQVRVKNKKASTKVIESEVREAIIATRRRSA